MERKMKVSIIIPVYNSEKYLKQCVDSILRQEFQDFEVILVDDESKDSSPLICDEYARKDDRVRVIHKKNGGTADSRNAGLKMASSDYITFMDNDDYWNSKTALKEMMEQLEESKADVLLYDTIEYWENTGKIVQSTKRCSRGEVVGKAKEVALKAVISKGLLHRAVWSKIIKKRLIDENQLFFEKGIRNEDTEWTAKMLLCAESYDWYEKVFYVYRKGTGSAQTDIRVKYKEVNDLANICEKYITISNEMKNSMFRNVFRAYLAYPYAVLMGQLQLLSRKEKNNIQWKYMKENADILLNDMDPSVKKVKSVYKLCGYNLTAFILKFYFLIK